MSVSKIGRHRSFRAVLAALPFALATFGAAHAINPDLRLPDYNHASWTTRDGAPAEVTVMAQTPDGWLWLGTSTGLFRFDGVRFERYEFPIRGEVAKRRIANMRAHGNGDLWISYSVGGVSVLHKDGRIDDIVPLDSPIGPIMTFAIVDDGSAWIATANGLYHYAHQQLRKIGPEQGLPQDTARGVLIDQYGQLWSLFSDGVYLRDQASGKFRLVLAQHNQGSLIQSPDGRIWIADADQVYPVAVDKTQPASARTALPRPARFNSAESRYLAQFDRDGNLWTRSCPEGLCIVARAGERQGGAYFPSREASDKRSPQLTLSSPSANAVLEDQEGNVWIATQGGLDRFRENRLVPVRLPPVSGHFSMAGDTEGGVWLSDMVNQMTWRLSAGGEPQRSSTFYQAMTNDRDGALLMVRTRDIERRFHGQVTYIPLPPARDGKVMDLDVAGLQDDGKVLWTTSQQTGLMGYIDGRWQPRSAFSLPPRIFIAGAGRKPGVRWQATGDATVVLNDNGKLTTYDAKDIGLATMVAVNDDVLIGGDLGLAIFNGHGFRKIKAARPEDLTNISGMAVSADGDRWFNGGHGVVHVRRDDWRAAAANPDVALQYELLGALDGYIGQAMLETRLPSVYMGRDGQIWFLTSAGVLRLSPGQIRRNAIAPVPQVMQLDAGGTSYAAVPGQHLPPGAQNFSIQFTAPGLGKPEAMRFQYQLSGINEEWQEAGARRTAYYTNVAPGSYTFRVRAINEDGVPGVSDAVLEFTIEPRFVQTIWFKALCAIAAAALLYLLYQYRMRVATRRVADQLTVRMAERERIARTLHDTFLQSVQALILRLDIVSHSLPEEARQKLMPILDQANDTIVEGRDQVYELRTGRVDDVETAIEEAGQFLQQEHPATAFGSAMAGPRRKLRDTIAEEACEIAREALRNAFQHANARHVEARVIYEKDAFRLQISDDGVGIAPDAAGKQKHYGLVGMRERATRAGGTLELVANPGGGLRVTLTVPARAAYLDTPRRGLDRFRFTQR